jgi:nucleoside-diphosphate-sugar epimerase
VVDGVFHLAAQPGVRGSWGRTFRIYLRENLLATQRVFEAAADAGVRVVFASSSSVYGNAPSYPTSESSPVRPVSP